MVIVETVALAIMVSNDIVMPLVLKRRASAGRRAERCRRAASDHAPHRDLRHLVPRLHLLPLGRRGAACRDRAFVVRRRRAIRAGFFRRPDLAARHRARRHRRHERRHSGLGLYAAAAEHFRCRHRRRAHLDRRAVGLAFLRPQALFGLDLPPLVHGVLLSLAVNIAFYIGCSLSRRPTAIERVQADVFVPSTLAPLADGAELPAAPRLGHRRGTDRDGRALSRRGAHARIFRELRR